MKLSDSAIAQVVKVIQLGFLTGTDISDNMRQMEFLVDGDSLVPDTEYLENFEENIKKMSDEVEILEKSTKVVRGRN